jgi:hypothetical protein
MHELLPAPSESFATLGGSLLLHACGPDLAPDRRPHPATAAAETERSLLRPYLWEMLLMAESDLTVQ